MGKKINLLGKTFGRLTVIGESAIKKHYRPTWVCSCECGVIKDVSSNALLNNLTNSCGCLHREVVSRLFSKPAGESAFNSILRDYRRHAKERNLCFNLTKDQFKHITQQSCIYCGIDPSRERQVRTSKFTYNGVDRLDNTIGYTLENSVPSCYICNAAKSNLSEKEFNEWINRLVLHQTKLN
jgi:hypothetical protein